MKPQHLWLLQHGAGAQHGVGAQHSGAAGAQQAGADGAQQAGSTGAQHDGSGAQQVGSGQQLDFFLQNKPASAVLANRTTTTDARDIHFILTSPQGNRELTEQLNQDGFPESFQVSLLTGVMIYAHLIVEQTVF